MKKLFFIIALSISISASAKIKEIKCDGYVINSFMVVYASAHREEDDKYAEFLKAYYQVVLKPTRYGKVRLVALAMECGFIAKENKNEEKKDSVC